MPVEIANGSVAVTTVQISGFAGSAITGSTVDNIVAQINWELVGDGLTITRSDATTSGIFFPLTGEFSSTFQILNQSGQELDDTDLTSQLADAVQQVGGTLVTAAVTKVVGAPSGVNTGTGSLGTTQVTAAGAAQQAQQAAGTTVHQCGDPTWPWYTDIPQALSCLTSKGLSTVGLLAIGLVIGVILIVGGKASGKLAI